MVPPQPARTLDQQVNRREIGDQGIKVQVQRLLDYLCGDQNLAGSLRGGAELGLAERINHPFLDLQAIDECETSVEDLRSEPSGHQGGVGFESVIDRVANVEHGLAAASCLLDCGQRLLRGAEESHRKPARPPGLSVNLHGCADVGSTDRG